jgi:hypothetical protein
VLKKATPSPGFAPAGKLKIGDDAIEYSACIRNDTAKTYTLTLTAGIASAHAAGEFVGYFYDPDEVIKWVVAHEAGHGCNLDQDADDPPTSIMDSIPAGTVDFNTKFRDNDPPVSAGANM